MKVPQSLIGLRIYTGDDSKTHLGVATVDLPSIEAMTTTVKGAGIAGEVTTPVKGQFGSMSTKLTWRVCDEQSLAFSAPDAVSLQCYGAYQVLDSGTSKLETHKLYVSVKGFTKKNEMGKMEVASPGEPTTEIEINYLKVEVDGKRYMEIDKFNYIAFHNGKDFLEDVRKALGME